ncbi:MAG: hypothetical protein RIR70_1419 [Pseudomonadota bacterium]
MLDGLHIPDDWLLLGLAVGLTLVAFVIITRVVDFALGTAYPEPVISRLWMGAVVFFYAERMVFAWLNYPDVSRFMGVLAAMCLFGLITRWFRTRKSVMGATGILLVEAKVGKKATLEFGEPRAGRKVWTCAALEPIPAGARVRVFSYLFGMLLVRKASERSSR